MFGRSEEDIIEIIGRALKRGENCHGKVGYYLANREISFYGLSRKEDLNRVEKKLDALLNYLKLEYKNPDTKDIFIVDKKK